MQFIWTQALAAKLILGQDNLTCGCGRPAGNTQNDNRNRELDFGTV